jgi:hypothetical protein
VTRLVTLAKLTGGPGSLRLLAILLIVGLIWVIAFPRRKTMGLLGLTAVALCYIAMATPLVAQWAVGRLPAAAPPGDGEIRHIQTLFIFDGDNRWGRLRESQRIYDLAHPREIVLLGRLSVYKDLKLMPIARESLRHDSDSWNTSTQIQRTRELWLTGGKAPAAVLASRLQAPRVRLLLREAGLPLPVIPAPLDVQLPDDGVRRLVPSLAALATTRDAIYEIVALRYYRGQV